jgi:hypothetical protein
MSRKQTKVFNHDPNTSDFVAHHEVCTCGHCRCDHHAGFAQCIVVNKRTGKACDCIRYTWPGGRADLPADHKRGERFPMPKGGRR